MVLKFSLLNGGNDWWWAIDNLLVEGEIDPALIPILSEWGFIILGLFFLIFGIGFLKNKQFNPPLKN